MASEIEQPPDLQAEALGSPYTTTNESTISEFSYSGPCALRVAVVTSPPNGCNERLWLDFYFFDVAGMRALDERDLDRFFLSEVYRRGYHQYRIDAGGWRDQEVETPHMLGVTRGVTAYNGVFELTPESWNQPGFWERFYERESAAVRIFEVERKSIIAADPWRLGAETGGCLNQDYDQPVEARFGLPPDAA